jgi:nicotinamidase-related amidase
MNFINMLIGSKKLSIIYALALVSSGIVAGYYFHKSNIFSLVVRKMADESRAFTTGRHVTINVRGLKPSDRIESRSNSDLEYYFSQERINISRTALILLDTWEAHDNNTYERRMRLNVEEKIRPLLMSARENGILVVYAPSGEKISKAIYPLSNEYIFETEFNYDIYGNQYDLIAEEFSDYLRQKGITTLIYAGYATNVCLLLKATGVVPMARKGFKIYVVSDATVAMEGPETIEGEWSRVATINTIELQFARSFTVDSFLSSLRVY